MKIIIAGSRNYQLSQNDIYMLNKLEYITEVISGGAKGVDYYAEKWAENLNFPIKIFPANWKKYGRAAGPIRNKQMAEYADALLLIWDGVSRGSANMKKEMTKLNKPIYEVILEGV